ncbi:hypothetical protein Taro_013921 [Colocasia esculenta]|uniref:Elongation factor G, mitochondrial n=1 Tax=Colocasia esculenta TaxID=4460 RepID=A0A843UHI8_COLES|nr:hypothetical protein [Colocasia esculenta]
MAMSTAARSSAVRLLSALRGAEARAAAAGPMAPGPAHSASALLLLLLRPMSTAAAARTGKEEARWKETLEKLRNIGISAHIDSGKTTLTERVLYYTGRIHEIHEVRGRDGVGAKMDSMDLEREKGITIQSAATYCTWNGYQVNIIDTPGHVDFTIEVERALRVLDGAILVLCSVGGVQSQSITVDRQMRRYEVPRLAFINKLDRMGADPWKVLNQARSKLRHHSAAVQVPIGLEEEFQGLVDLVQMKAYYFQGSSGEKVVTGEIPPNMEAIVAEKRHELIETVSEVDDKLAEFFLSDEPISPSDLEMAIRRATVSRKFVPVFMGSAFKNKGVQPLLDGVISYLPCPAEVENYALDQTKNEEKVPRLVRMHSDEMEDIQEAYAGQIVAVFGVDCASGDTFTDGSVRYTMTSMNVPEPVMSLAVSPVSKDSGGQFSKALNRFQKEDPTFRVGLDAESGQTIISGMGELHLDIYVERIRREYKVDAVVGKPRVNFRETVTQRANFDYLHKKQSGGQGQFGRVIGIQIDQLELGSLIGHPVENVRIVLTDGASHAVDSSELAFKLAAIYAFRQCYTSAKPVILEPVMLVELKVPTEFQGSVTGDINKRKGLIVGNEQEGDDTVITSHVPLNNMFGYSTALRSMTQGKGEFTMEYKEHLPVSQDIQTQLVNSYKATKVFVILQKTSAEVSNLSCMGRGDRMATDTDYALFVNPLEAEEFLYVVREASVSAVTWLSSSRGLSKPMGGSRRRPAGHESYPDLGRVRSPFPGRTNAHVASAGKGLPIPSRAPCRILGRGRDFGEQLFVCVKRRQKTSPPPPSCDEWVDNKLEREELAVEFCGKINLLDHVAFRSGLKAAVSLSELPDDVLALISSKLGLRDAVRLGFLLFGRQQLGKSLHNLSFTYPSMFGLDSPSSSVCGDDYVEFKAKLGERTSRFVRAVDMFIDLHAGIKVESFSVDFTMGEAQTCLLDRWLRFAFASGCKEIDLNLKEVVLPFRFIFADFCEFPVLAATADQASSLLRLSLSSCSLRPPRDFSGFGNLKFLRLHFVPILEADLDGLLAKCPNLEHLVLSWCFWWDYLRISNPAAKLKYLQVSGCDGLLKLEISAANLATFEYKGPRETCLIVKHAPQLVRASVHVYPQSNECQNDLISGLSRNLPQLRTLFLHFAPEDEMKYFNFGEFTNLKYLVVNAATLPTRCFLWPAALFKAAPFVESFQLNLHPGNEVELFLEGPGMNTHRPELPPPPPPPPTPHPHHHLKQVEISGYTGYTPEIELVMYVFSNAAALESMTLDPRRRYYAGDHEWKWLSCSEDAKSSFWRTYPVLLGAVPPGVNLVIR